MKAEKEADAPENMPLPLPLYFKVAVQMLVDFFYLKVISFRFCLIFIQTMSISLLFLQNNDVE
jgi:hypothetical protein